MSDRTSPSGQDASAEVGNLEGGGLVGVSIRNPVFTTMMMAALLVLGIVSFGRLPIDQYPDISIPVVSIQTTYAGASPETVEKEVTRRIEESVNPIQGVDKITSVSVEGVSSIVVEFELGTDLDAATADVRSKIEQTRRRLPDEIDPPIVQTFDPSEQPIVSLSLSSRASGIGDLTSLADDDIRKTLEGVDGVGRVQITGGLEREVHVQPRPDALRALSLSVQDVLGALGQQNLEIPAGRIEQGNREDLVRVFGRIERPEQFGRIVVANRDGVPIRLAQVADVLDTTEEARSIAYVNGERAVGIDVLKVSGANTVDVAEEVKEVVADLQTELGDETSLAVIRDNSVYIRQSVESVQEELLMGALLTVLVVFLFLNDPRATAITSLALPVSVISTFILLSVLGFTLNILTLLALSLSIGILIDDAIVVIENIVRHKEAGKTSFRAALDGTREIILAVMAATFTIVAVFVPVAFMGGIIGKFFYEFGITVAWAVLVSLFVSFTLTPMLSAWWEKSGDSAARRGRVRRALAWVRGHTVGAFNRWFDRRTRSYEGLIRWVLGHRKLTLGLAGASFVAAIMLFPLVGGSFMPEQDEGEFVVNFETPAGSSLAYTESKAIEVAGVLRGLEGVDYTYTTVGGGAQGTVSDGNAFVKLLPAGERGTSQQALMVEARARLTSLYGVETSVLVGGGLGGAAKPIQISLRGAEVAPLQELSDAVVEAVRAVPGAIEVETSLGGRRPEVRLEVDLDRANDLGLDAGSIAGTLQPLLSGRTATTWEAPDGEEYDVVVRLPLEARTTRGRIASLPILAGADGTDNAIELGQVATIVEGEAPAQIDREALERSATVSANLLPGQSLGQVSAAIQTALDGIAVPAGYSVSMGGETEELAETTGYVVEALFLAIVLIYLILASQFGSFLQPIGIMVSLPLSIVGVMLALLLTGNTLNIMSMIGVIMLMGLVTKNAILLVDNANLQRKEGLSLFDSAARAGAVRLRPIMMTTISMIFGMLPIALGLGGEGGEFRAPMAIAVIGGVTTSTLLTLIVIPVVYTYLEQMSAWARARSNRPKQVGDREATGELAGAAG